MDVISVGVSEDQKYIEVKTRGDIKRNNYDFAGLIEVYELATKAGINQLLIDMTETRNLQSHLDNFEIVNTTIANEPKIYRNMRIALLVAPDDHSHDFVETVTKNAGFNLTLFRDREKAIEFLTKKR